MSKETGTRISRRRLLGSGAVAGAGALAAGVPGAQAAADRKKKAKSHSKVHKADVCVVGAGISGLTAARTLHKAG
jgi:monoamine oxidase